MFQIVKQKIQEIGRSFVLVILKKWDANKKNRERGSYCDLCGSVMLKERYAVDFVVYGCTSCKKTFYIDDLNCRWIELAIPFEDFFEE
jgi:hypothetical protein